MVSWRDLSTAQKMAVTLGISAGAAVLYIYYTKYRRESLPPEPTDNDAELHITVPQEAVNLLIGRGGTIRKRLKRQTDAHIEVSAEPNSSREYELTIKGSPSQVCQAKEAVYGILQENAALRVELLVPTRCIYRIIGQGGDRIRAICKSSGAKIHCDKKTRETDLQQNRRITVTGTKDQIEAAKLLIQKVSEEDEHVLQRAAESSAIRCRRKEIIAVKKREVEDAGTPREEHPTERSAGATAERSAGATAERSAGATAERSAGDPTGWNETKLARGDTISGGQNNDISDTTYEVPKFEVASPDFTFRADEFVDVYVSATENPEHFWIQILGSRSSQLDKLTTEMSDHYEMQQPRGERPEIRVGDIVAAPFYTDLFWYRAEVLGFLDNGNADLYYVDYGDSWDSAPENLFPLRSDFLSLPFQAIECSLSGIAPAGEVWSKEALDEFDDLTYCAKWKPLLAKICSFPSPGMSCFQVQLYDPSKDPNLFPELLKTDSLDQSLDIGMQMVHRGYAVVLKQSPVQTDEDDKLVARLVEEVTSLSVDLDKGGFEICQDEQTLPSDGSFDLLRSDVEPEAVSSLEPPCRLMSTPTNQPGVSNQEEESLEESIAKIQIGSDEESPVTPISESTPPSTPPSVQSTDSSTGSSSNTSPYTSSSSTCSEEQSLLSSPLTDSSIYSPRGCFYYLSTEEASTSTGFNSSSCEIITISSGSEDEQSPSKKSPSEVLLSSDSDDDVIVVENPS